MVAQQGDVAVETGDVAIGARLHHRAFHHRQDEFGERRPVECGGEPAPGLIEAAGDRRRPAREIGGEQAADRRVRLVKLEREAADRAAIGAFAGRRARSDRRRATRRSARSDPRRRSRPAPAAIRRCRRDRLRARRRARPACRGRHDRGCRYGPGCGSRCRRPRSTGIPSRRTAPSRRARSGGGYPRSSSSVERSINGHVKPRSSHPLVKPL